MSFVKLCLCGNKVEFEQRMSFPNYCPFCGRDLVPFQTYRSDDPQLEELLKRTAAPAEPVPVETPAPAPASAGKLKCSITLSNGKVITIPDGGCIIGRTETGAEELAEYSSVSRQHLRIFVRRNIGVLIEDLSTYGTLVNGQRIPKNEPQVVQDGARITLCNVEAVLNAKEDNG